MIAYNGICIAYNGRKICSLALTELSGISGDLAKRNMLQYYHPNSD